MRREPAAGARPAARRVRAGDALPRTVRTGDATPGSVRAGEPVPRSHLRAADIGPLALLGLASRPARAILSALGVALGIATMVAVLGISGSSRAQLLAQIDALGTNLLTVTPGQSFTGQPELGHGAMQHGYMAKLDRRQVQSYKTVQSRA